MVEEQFKQSDTLATSVNQSADDASDLRRFQHNYNRRIFEGLGLFGEARGARHSDPGPQRPKSMSLDTDLNTDKCSGDEQDPDVPHAQSVPTEYTCSPGEDTH